MVDGTWIGFINSEKMKVGILAVIPAKVNQWSEIQV